MSMIVLTCTMGDELRRTLNTIVYVSIDSKPKTRRELRSTRLSNESGARIIELASKFLKDQRSGHENEL